MAFILGAVIAGAAVGQAAAGLCPLASNVEVIEHDLTGHLMKKLKFHAEAEPSVTIKRRREKRDNPLLRITGYSTMPSVSMEGENILVSFEGQCAADMDQASSSQRMASGLFWPFTAALLATARPWTAGLLAATGLGVSPAEAADTCTEVLELEVVMPECAICMTGCAPYQGVEPWWPTMQHMSDHCDLVVHTGDLISKKPCNRDTIGPVLDAFKNTSTPALYTVGDNEVNDCFRLYGTQDQDFVKAKDARDWIIEQYYSDLTTDLTGTLQVDTQSQACPFNVYVEKCGVAVVTIEVPGSYWYLHDESAKYPDQNVADPLADRKAMYDTAKDCALQWLDASVQKVKTAGLPAMMVFYHAAFWESSATNLGSSDDFGSTLLTKGWTGHYANSMEENPYQPLADKLYEIVDANPDIHFVTGHADQHYWKEQSPKKKANYVNVMVEGATPAMTSYGRFKVDASDKLNTIQINEIRVPVAE